MYELAIIGGGPAGIAAGIYAARKKLNTILITDSFGGQSVVSDEIQNWIGEPSISGFELAKKLENHLRAQTGVTVAEGDRVKEIKKNKEGFSLHTDEGKQYETKMLLIAAGSRRRKLGVPGEEELEGRGVAYCGTCDAPLFEGKNVAVVGGGNSGLETVLDLAPYAAHIYLIHRNSFLKGDLVTQEKIRALSHVTFLLDSEVTAVSGNKDKMVEGLRYKNSKTGAEKTLAIGGVFVEIGAIPNGDVVKDFAAINDWGQIIVDHKTQRSSDPAIWAAGDVADGFYKQNNISVGDAIKAVMNIYDTLRAK